MLLLLVGVAGLSAAASVAVANHIAGATYNGNVGGGSLSFTVTPDGSGISSVSYSGPLQGSTCTFSGGSANYVQPLPITNHSFNDSTPPLYFSGTFNGPQRAQGTLRVRTTNPSCDTGDLPWTATTTAQPPVTARCAGKPATIVGTNGPDSLPGTPRRDVVAARGGNDIVRGRSGNDLVCGGTGKDTEIGGPGNDKLRGDAGNDVLKGNAGKDVLTGGGGGNDTCVGGGGRDSANCETERGI